ncbi:polyketide antibiotic transporter [Kineococcus gypseus]|uniref:polyketide antibiotic transporter n=1 Tax=Kineococcus gypseus TaxID=1637102 RepID=UPI003D7D57D0
MSGTATARRRGAAGTAGTGGTAGAAGAPGAAVLRLALRHVRRGGAVVVLLAAALSGLVAASHAGVVADPAAAAALRAIADDPAVRTLFGAPVALELAGGFAVWRTGTVLAVLLGAWSVLATTRTTRGEEESGRWNLLLSGRLTLRAAVGRCLLAVAVTAVAAGAAVALALALTGAGGRGALVHGAGLAAAGLFSAALAALTAQVFDTRSTASGTAVAVLGAGLLTRAVAEGVPGLSWLRWGSPFGLLGASSPYGRDRLAPLLVLLTAAAALAALALVLAGRRDVGEGLLARPAHRRARTALLGGVAGFAARRALRPLAGWCAGTGAYFLLIGATAPAVTDFLADQRAVSELAGRAGFGDLGSVRGFTATLLALLALPAGACAAVRVADLVRAETDRRLVLLAAGPVGRLRLLGAEAAAACGGVLVLVTVAGLATWAGVAAAGGGLAPGEALRGAWNVVPVALLCLGAAVLAVGWSPSAVALVGSLPAVAGFLLQAVADSTGAPGWVRELSPFSHLALVPLEPADATAALVMTALAVVLAAAGAARYRRRDLAC